MAGVILFFYCWKDHQMQYPQNKMYFVLCEGHK